MMKIAVPTSNGVLDPHFGHCQAFTIFEVDIEQSKIQNSSLLQAPPHEPGLLPKLLSEKGVDVVIAGGMGLHAQQLFSQRGITVIVGAPAIDATEVVEQYMAGTLDRQDNMCDH